MATLEDVEGWLVMIAQHTRETKEAVQGRAGAASPAKTTTDSSMFDKIKKSIEDGLKTGLASGIGQAKSLAARGFAGTTEQAQNSYAMDMLAKQFAAVMMPVMQGMTYLAAQVEMRMRGMNGSEQNRMMGGILGGAVGLKYGGLGGGLAGMALGSAVLGDSPGGSLAGAAGGAYLGYRVGGPIGAGIGTIVGGVAGAPGHYKDEKPWGEGGYYQRMRAGGASGVGAFADTAFHSLSAMWGGKGGKRPDERRDVTPFQADMMEAGGTSGRVQEALIRATAGRGFEDGGMFKPIIDAILMCYDQLVIARGGTPPPRSATA